MKRLLLIVISLSIFNTQANDRITELEKKIDDLQSEVEELTYRGYERYFTISGSLKNHYESYQEVSEPGTSSEDENTVNTLSSIFALNINFDVNKRIKIYSKLGMSKFWNYDSDSQAGTGRREPLDSWDASNTGSWGMASSAPKFDRAYLSYNNPDSNFTFAIGRLPTNMGPPSEKSDGQERQGTYPRFAYNAIFDGMGFAYNGSHLVSKGDSLSIRAFYSPFVNIDKSNRRVKRVESGETADTLTPQYTLQIEHEKKGLSWVENLHSMFFLYNYSNFFQWETEDPNDDSDGYLSYFEATAQSYYLGFENLFKTKFSLFASYLYVRSGYSEEGDTEKDNYSSHAALISSTYDLGSRKILGLEYIKTDKDFYIDDFNYFYLSDFYKAENVEGLHLSYLRPLYDNLDLKFGVFSYRKRPGTVDEGTRNVNSFYSTLSVTF